MSLTYSSYVKTPYLSLGVLFGDPELYAWVYVGAQVFTRLSYFRTSLFVIGSHVSQVGLEHNM